MIVLGVRAIVALTESKTYFRSLPWGIDRKDVFRRKREQLKFDLGRLLDAAGGMLDVDTLQLVGNEAGVTPCLWVAHLIDLCQHVTVFFPCRLSKRIVIVS